jgi:hypothetical protein
MRRFSTLVKMTDPAALAKHLEGKVLVDGAFRSVASRFDVKSPATGKLIAGAARGTEKVIFLVIFFSFFFSSFFFLFY